MILSFKSICSRISEQTKCLSLNICMRKNLILLIKVLSDCEQFIDYGSKRMWIGGSKKVINGLQIKNAFLISLPLSLMDIRMLIPE